VLSGDLPCTIAVDGQRRPATIAFSLDLRPAAVPPGPAHPLTVFLVLDGVAYQVADDWFEDGVQRLERALPPGVRLVCCVTCLFSDHLPGGHGLTGIRCHREAKEQYLTVRSKQTTGRSRSPRKSPRPTYARNTSGASPVRLPRLTQFIACPQRTITYNVA